MGLTAPGDLLASLASPEARFYVPHPKGLLSAREAVARHHVERGVPCDPERLVLTASSSEAYGWLSKLLCEPGDAVLVPAPSYPLLDALAGLESVELHRYRLEEADGWRMHAANVEHEVERLLAVGKRPKAVVLVSPNNPTGSLTDGGELESLLEIAARHGLAIVSDEVFLDYRFAPRREDAAVAAEHVPHPPALVFSLGGLSKTAALPQLKLGWILANGPSALLAEALERLEWIADSYLSVATPVQLALPAILARVEELAAPVRARVLENFAHLTERFPPDGASHPLPLVGGWSAVLRVAAGEGEEDLVLRLLEQHDVLVQPGYFFDFPHEAFLVLSLLPPPDVFQRGVRELSIALPST